MTSDAHNKKEEAHILTEAETAHQLRRSVGTIRRQRRKGLIGYLKIGARVFYTQAQIDTYLESRTIEPCIKTNTSKSGAIGSRGGQTVTLGAEHGSTLAPDKRDAHRLAQKIFGKRN